MSAISVAAPDVNYWHDRKCARAFWSQCEVRPYKQLLRDTAEWLDPGPGEDWVDLGCGSGQLTRTLWEKSGGSVGRIVALDCAETNVAAIAKVRDSVHPRAAADRMSFQHVDFSAGLGMFPTASFHGAVSGLAIQYAQHFDSSAGRWTQAGYDHLLAEVYRVLRPGGRFVFSVNVPEPSWLRVAVFGLPAIFRTHRPLRFLRNSLRMMRYGSWLKREARRGRFHYLPADVIAAKLKDAGFERIEHRCSFARQAFIFRAYRHRIHG